MNNLLCDIKLNRDIFEQDFLDCSDFLLRPAIVNGTEAFFCVMDGLVDSLQLSQMVTAPILSHNIDFDNPDENFEKIKNAVVGSV